MKKKGSFVKRAGNYAVFLLKNVGAVLFLSIWLLIIPVCFIVGWVDTIGQKIASIIMEIILVGVWGPLLYLFLSDLPIFSYTCIWHDYDGCKCRICGVIRNKGHNYDGCTCHVCGKQRDEGHDFDGCTCRICGKTRDEGHDFDGCTCRICGKIRDKGHDFDGCVCRICGKIRDKGHDFDGCVCRKCGTYIHDWEEVSRYIHEVEGTIGYESGNEYVFGGYTEEVITYYCRRCGEKRTEVNRKE